MSSTDTDNKETTCEWICKTIWTILYTIIFLFVYVGSMIQLMLSIAFSVFAIVVSIFLYNKVYKKADDVANNTVFVFMDDLLGTGSVSQINEANRELIIFVVVLLILASVCIYISVHLCRGLNEQKVDNVIRYFIAGTIVLGFRVWNITADECHNFPEDLTILYCGLYANYLVLMSIVAVQMYKLMKIKAASANVRTKLLNSNLRTELLIRTFLATIRTRSGGGSDGSTIPYATV